RAEPASSPGSRTRRPRRTSSSRPGDGIRLMAQYSLGIDIGGTFTDIVIYDHDAGPRCTPKVLPPPDDPARALAAGPAGLLTQARVDPAAVSRTVHATTLFTNA